ncbi:MAG: methyltransferase domain-containing protein [Pyrinomonadaceae bacterium]
MSEQRTEKELAFLHDLSVAPDWGERFAELIDEHVKLPKKGRVLYVAAGTGGHALALAGRAGKDVTLIGVDESEERLELARAKSLAAKLDDQAEFRHGQLEALDFEDEQFDLVLGDASMVAVERLPEILAEVVRVAAPGATVALTLPTAASFGEFYSVYWEALMNAGVNGQEHLVESFIRELPTVSDLEQMLEREGLDEVRSWTRPEEFDFASGEEFLNAPLVKNFLMENWLAPLSAETERGPVVAEVARIIDEERQETEFALSVKATLALGRKAG